MDICPRCGKQSRAGKLCTTCTAEEQGVEKLQTIQIKVCSQCNSFFSKNTWIRFNDFRQVEHKILGKKAGEIKPLFTTCVRCSKTPASNYYEGILQLRNQRPGIVRFIRAFNEKNKGRGQFIMKEVQVHGGLDFYVANQKLLMKLGKQLLRAFGGVMKANAKIHTRDTQASKDIYRMTVLFQAFPFERQQLVAYGNQVIKVTQLGRQCYGEDLDTHKRILLTPEMKLAPLEVVTAIVAKTRPLPEVLHPATFQSTPIVNPSAHFTEGNTVTVAVHDGKIYLTEPIKKRKR